jgi:hypothetical protein
MRAVVAASCLLMGCLVTKKEFPQEPTCPPSIETATLADPNYPLGNVIKLDLSEEPTEDGGPGARDLTFNFQVRDCDEDQRLTMRLFSSISLSDEPIRERLIPPQERNPYEITLPRSTFTAAAGTCQKVELYVSAQFAPDPEYRRPAEEGDLGTATWWLAVTNTENPGVEMVLCP